LLNLAQNDHYTALHSYEDRRGFKFAQGKVSFEVDHEFCAFPHQPQEMAVIRDLNQAEMLDPFLEVAAEDHPATHEPYVGICDLVVTSKHPFPVKPLSTLFATPIEDTHCCKTHLRPTRHSWLPDITNGHDLFASTRVISEYSVLEEQAFLVPPSRIQDSSLPSTILGQTLSDKEDSSALIHETSGSYEMDLPLLLVDHSTKLASTDPVAGVNRMRMNAASTAKCLAALGVLDFPVFSLLTDGTLGVVTCTIASTLKTGGRIPSEVCYDIILKPVSVVHCFTSILGPESTSATPTSLILENLLVLFSSSSFWPHWPRRMPQTYNNVLRSSGRKPGLRLIASICNGT